MSGDSAVESVVRASRVVFVVDSTTPPVFSPWCMFVTTSPNFDKLRPFVKSAVPLQLYLPPPSNEDVKQMLTCYSPALQLQANERLTHVGPCPRLLLQKHDPVPEIPRMAHEFCRQVMTQFGVGF